MFFREGCARLVVTGVAALLLGHAQPAAAQAPLATPAHNAPDAEGLLVPGMRLPVPFETPSGTDLVAGEHVVRSLYLIPSNRTPQAHAVGAMRSHLVEFQAWFRDQMGRYGFGPKTFRFETEDDGVTPRVHLVYAPDTDNYYRADPWGRVTTAAANAGLPLWAQGQVWLEYYEGHILNPDGRFEGDQALGGSFGSGSDGGVGLRGSVALAFMVPGDLLDDRLLDGLIKPELGPYPMRQGVTFGESTISAASSGGQGAMPHELGHAFGLPHDFRNDNNFHGNVMGNGLRGWRGWMYPQRYLRDDVYLSYGAALALNNSRYFNPATTYTEDIKPNLSVLTAGAVTPVNGQVPVRFTATDASGLAAAFLTLRGDMIAELPLSGTSVDATFLTPQYTSGAANDFRVFVYDTQGNRQDVATSITPATGINRAPLPFLRLLDASLNWANATPNLGQTRVLDASSSSDPDHSAASLQVEWDVDGDGVFDTTPTTNKRLSVTFSQAGVRVVRVRVTDPLGAQSVSAPIPVRVQPLGPTFTLYRLDYAGTYFFLTGNQAEHDFLVNNGWTSRGPAGFVYPSPSNAPGLVPLYRIYQPASGDHFYTTDQAERNTALTNYGYADEGVAGYVFNQSGQVRKPLFRAYNPNTGQHRFTGSALEYNTLSSDWIKEGVACYVRDAH